MDDGSCFSGNRKGLKIATNSFILEELNLLCNLLLNKYSLNCSLHKDKDY
jgi:hypothetical protein